VQQDEVAVSFLTDETHKSRKRAWHCDHAERGRCLQAAPFTPQQQANAEGFVQNARKGMRRIDRYRRQKWIDLGLVELQRLSPSLVAQLIPLQYANL